MGWGLIHHSGGLLYHWRALRHSRRWKPFREELATWLKEEWNPPAHRPLVLIGPSAGYTLPNLWLRQFSEVIAYDFDPLIPFLFRLQHPRVAIRFQVQDLFWKKTGFSSVRLSLEGLRQITEAHPEASFLFCNVLGQLPEKGRVEESDWLAFISGLKVTFAEKNWATFHDVFSQEQPGVRVDHMLEGIWGAEFAVRRMEWALTSGKHHWIEAVRFDPPPRTKRDTDREIAKKANGDADRIS